VIDSQIEGSAEFVQWMPAHTAASAVGTVLTSEGTAVTDDMWHANQLVDLLAKKGAESSRHDARDRGRFLGWERQVHELVIFLGRLTCVANGFKLPNGEKVRDSEALPNRLRAKRAGNKRACKAAVHGNSSSSSSRGGGTNVVATPVITCRRVRSKYRFVKRGLLDNFRAAKKSRVARTMVAYQASKDASFMESWCELLSTSLKPPAGPSAAERMKALKLRLLSKGVGSSGSK